MTPGRPLLIASLPGRSRAAVRAEISEARDAGADVAEIRFDRWRDEERSRAGELFPSPLPLMATYRSAAEGGEGSDDREVRRRILAGLLVHPFRFVDLEEARDPSPPADPARPVVPIRSRHLGPGAGAEAVARAVRSDPKGAAFVKVVVPASVGEALGPVRSALPTDEHERWILHTTGPSAPLFRAWAWRLGFPAVYGSLPEVPGRRPLVEGQIPVDRLRFYVEGESPGPLFAVVGHPIGHSASPAIFSAWMRARGERGLYVGLDIDSESDLATAVAALGSQGFRGLNVTRPWKLAALELASRIGPGAGPCGCANVLTFGPGGSVEAENTDLAAMLRRLRELRDGGAWDGRSLTVVGSGGGARATLVAARSLGAASTLLARNPDAQRRLAAEFGAAVASPPGAPTDLLVNTTPIGRSEGGPMGVDLAPWIGPSSRVLDLVYAADDPILERLARSRGATYEDGRRLLAYQAAETYAIWWGAPPEEREVRAVLEGVT